MSEATVFLVPVLMEVVADTREQARERASSAIDYMMQVSNDEGHIKGTSVFEGAASSLAKEVEPIGTTPRLPSRPITVIVGLDGGLVESVVSAVPVEVVVVDFDVEGADKSELTAIPQQDGTTRDASVWVWSEGEGGARVSDAELAEVVRSIGRDC